MLRMYADLGGECPIVIQSKNPRRGADEPALRNRAELGLLEVARKEIDRLGRHANRRRPSRFAATGSKSTNQELKKLKASVSMTFDP